MSKIFRTWFAVLFAVSLPFSSASAHSTNQREQQGAVGLTLCVPTEGVKASEKTEFTFQVTLKAGDSSEAPAACLNIKCQIVMPAMPGMPEMVPVILSKPMLGDYSLFTNFPHGGLYEFLISGQVPSQTKPFLMKYFVNVGDADPTNSNTIVPPFSLRLTSVPAQPKAGQPVHLTLAIISQETGSPITVFDTEHTKKMHLILVRDDLGRFFHEHPVLHPDGTFTHTFTFPTSGRWVLFADTAPSGFGARVASAPLRVTGPKVVPVVLKPQPQPVSQADGMTLTMLPTVLESHQTRALQFILTDVSGHPVTDTQPWLGAPAHWVSIDQTVTLYVHTHPSDRTPEEIQQGVFTFLTRFPASGIFKCWIQIQRNNTVHTFPFVVTVSETPAQ